MTSTHYASKGSSRIGLRRSNQSNYSQQQQPGSSSSFQILVKRRAAPKWTVNWPSMPLLLLGLLALVARPSGCSLIQPLPSIGAHAITSNSNSNQNQNNSIEPTNSNQNSNEEEILSYEQQQPTLENFNLVDPFGATFDQFLKDQPVTPSSKPEITIETHIRQDKPDDREPEVAATGYPGERKLEVQQLFAWKELPTNKCTRPCGRGLRIYHISCVDLKYDVRVENELCALKANSVRPSDTRPDDFCNELACPPEWLDSTSGLACPEPGARQCECSQLDALGRRLSLDPSKCPQARPSKNHSKHHPHHRHHQSTQPEVDVVEQEVVQQEQQAQEEKLQKKTNEQEEEEEVRFELGTGSRPETEPGNEILLQEVDEPESLHNHRRHHENHAHPHGQVHWSAPSDLPAASLTEPHLEPLSWGECRASQCGQLGLRRRELVCRMWLAKSAKLIDLPMSRCQAPGADLASLATSEPCYLDCEQQQQQTGNSTASSLGRELELADETIYDLEMTRFEWRHQGWTHCSAACLGGVHEPLIECWDKVTGSPTDSSLCEPERRPEAKSERCNEQACQPEWLVQALGECSSTCGSSGFMSRQVACVQRRRRPDRKLEGNDSSVISSPSSSTITTDNEYYLATVADEQCAGSGPLPARQVACNRVDCQAEWVAGPWSQCNSRCGAGQKTRNVTCVQELARPETEVGSGELNESDKLKQLPFEDCYALYRMVPALEERCYGPCLNELFLDSDPDQDFRVSPEAYWGASKKRVMLRVGGRAHLYEGMNLRLRCKPMIRQSININSSEHLDSDHHLDEPQLPAESLVRKVEGSVEWKFQGQLIFPGGTLKSERGLWDARDQNRLDSDEFNEIQLMNDQPAAPLAPNPMDPNHQHQHHQHHHQPHHHYGRRRNLKVRSSSQTNSLDQDPGNGLQVRFYPDPDGRFKNQVRENLLKIKRLKFEDSGTYTCSMGNATESLELHVSRLPDSAASKLNRLGVTGRSARYHTRAAHRYHLYHDQDQEDQTNYQ